MNQGELVVFPISKRDIVNKNYKNILTVIKQLEKTNDFGYKRLWASFSGFDDIPDEVFEIKEIRDFTQGLIAKCPHLFYFLSEETQIRQSFLTTVADIEMTYKGERKSIVEWVELGHYTQETLPKMTLHVSLSDKTFKLLKNGTKQFGIKTGDFIGTRETIKYLEGFYHEKR